MATMPRPPLPGGPGGAPGAPPGGAPPGGPPGLGGPMLQGLMGGLAGQMPGGNPAQALRSLQQTPGPDNIEQAIRQAQETVGYAMSQIHQRSPEVAKELASALMNLKQAAQKLQAIPRQDVQRPPPGLGPMLGMMGGGMPPGGPAMGPPAND